MPQVRTFQGKPIIRAGKIALGDACCDPCTGNATNGACCEPFPLSGCFIGTLESCSGFNGNFQGVGTNCGPINPCPGACCNVGVCYSNVTRSDCEDSGGTFLGYSTTCAEVDCTCCPMLDNYTTFTLQGSVLGCDDGDITIPLQSWTKGSPAFCDALSLHEWYNGAACSCTFMAMNCPPPFFTAIDFLVADCDGCSDPTEFNTATQLDAMITCDGQVYFAGSSQDDSPACKCEASQITTFQGPYALASSIDVTLPADVGDPDISFRFIFTAA